VCQPNVRKVEGPGFKMQFGRGFFKSSLLSQQGLGYLTLFRTGKDEGGEGEEWRKNSVMPLLGKVPPHSHWLRDNRCVVRNFHCTT